MPEEKKKLSQTMRIDLIPDVPAAAEPGQKKRVLVTPSSQRQKQERDTAGGSAEDRRYKELLESIYDAAIISDASGHIVDVNTRAIEFLQFDRAELTGMTVFDIVAGTDEQLIATLCQNLENERFTLIQAYCVRKDGTYFPAELAVNKLSIGGFHLCFFIRDTTLRRQEQEMLRTEHMAIQNAGNGIAVTDLDARLEYVNPAFGRMWGYENADDLLGQDVRALLSDEAEATRAIATVMESGQPVTVEMKAKRIDESLLDVQMSAVCNRNSDGDVVGAVLSFLDVSDRRRAEEATREAERRRVMLESLGAACHHLGQPATVLLANLGLIQRRVSSVDPVTKELMDSSITAAESLGDILHRLNTVNEYRTTQYLDRSDAPGSEESRILEI